MRKITRLCTVFIAYIAMLSVSVYGYGDTVSMYWDKPSAKMYSKEYFLSSTPVRHNKVTYLPVDDTLKVCGFSLGWDSNISAVTAVKGNVCSYVIVNSPVLWKGEQQYISPNSTMIYNGIFYMPIDMAQVLTDDIFIVSDFGAMEKAGKRDLLIDTVVSDKSRISGEIFRHNNVAVVGNFGMMVEPALPEEAKDYISAVNAVADASLENVNVYNIIVPTSAEFYAPKDLYLNQTEQIKMVYTGLSERVMPVNVVKTLDEHSGENIYFRTDHHWTQRGAYYAYKEFMHIKGETPPILSDFVRTVGPFSGSISSFAKDTYAEQVMLNNPETIEKFYPIYYTGGACYLDMYMKKYACPIEPVYYHADTYLSFIGGDMPLVVFTTGIDNGRKLLILKESFGNAFATWALNNYSEVYVVDVRQFNNGEEEFKLDEFYGYVKFDDLVIINSASSFGISENLRKIVD